MGVCVCRDRLKQESSCHVYLCLCVCMCVYVCALVYSVYILCVYFVCIFCVYILCVLGVVCTFVSIAKGNGEIGGETGSIKLPSSIVHTSSRHKYVTR